MKSLFTKIANTALVAVLLTTVFYQNAFSQCGNVNTIIPTVSSNIVCSGSQVIINAFGLPVKKWVYRDNGTGAWLVNNTASVTLYDYPYVSAMTVRSYRAVVGTTTCPTDSTQSVNVTITPLSFSTNNNITISSSATGICSGSYLNLNLLGSTGTVQAWLYKNNSGNWIQFNSGSESVQDYSTSVSTITTRSYRALIKQANTCNVDSSSILSVMINPPVYGNNNSIRPSANVSTICGGSSFVISIDWSASLIAGWVYRDNSVTTWGTTGYSGSNNWSESNTNVSVVTTRYYRALLRNTNSCNIDTSDALIININPSVKKVLSTITPVYTGGNVCAGNSFNVQLTGYSSSNVLNWIYRDSVSQTWISQTSGTTSPNFSTNSNLSRDVTREIRAVINNASTTCSIDTSAPVYVNIKSTKRGNTTSFMPLISNANICSGAPVTVYMTTSSVYVSLWIYRNNNSGNWLTISSGSTFTDNNTSVTSATTKSYRAVITSSANCSADTTNEVNTFISLPTYGGKVAITPTANNPGYCSGSTVQGNISLSTQQGVVKWIYRDNSAGTWIDLTNSSGNYFYDYYTSSLITPTIRSYAALIRNNETCKVDTSNSVNVQINPMSFGTVSLIPISITGNICSGTASQMQTSVPAGYSVQNWLYRDTTYGSYNTFGYSSANPYDYSTTVSYNRTRNYRVLFYNSTGCRYDTGSFVSININAKGKGNNGIVPTSNQTSICGGSTSINVQVTGVSTVQKWIYKDNNTGAWLDVPNSSSSASYTDQAINTGVLVNTIRAYRSIVDNSATCRLDTTSSVSVIINPVSGGVTSSIIPTVSGSTSICNGSSASISFSYSGTVQKWIYKDNSGSWFDFASSTSTSYYDNNIRVTTPTSRQYKAVIYRTGGVCIADTTQIVTVYINPYQFGNAVNPVPTTSSSSVCSGSNASVSISTVSGQSIQKWIYRDNGNGTWLDFTYTTNTTSLVDVNTTLTSSITRAYRAIISQSSCSFDTTSAVNVTINIPVNGNQFTATPTSSTPIICSGSTVNLSISGYSGSIRKWIYSNNGGAWLDVTNSNSSSVSQTNTNVSFVTTRSYRVLLVSTTCSIDSSAIYNVTINPVGAGNINTLNLTSSVGTLCAIGNPSVTLSVSPPTNYSIRKWIQSDNGVAWNDFGYATQSTSLVNYTTGISSSTVRSFRAILNNSVTCSNDTSNFVSVVMNPAAYGTNYSVTPTSSRSVYCYGIPVSMNVSSPSNYTIQKWIFRDNAGVWKDFDYTTTSSSQTDNNTYVGATTSRSYRVLLSSSSTCAMDTTATLNVVINNRTSTLGASTVAATALTPTICSGNTAQVRVIPTGANTVYKWIYSNSGATGPWYDAMNSYSQTTFSHTNTVVSTSTNRIYRAIMSDTSTCDYDSSISTTVLITPLSNGSDTLITPSTSSDTVCIGTSVSLSVSVGSNSVVKWIYRDNKTGPWLDFGFFTASTSLYDNTSPNIAGGNNRSYRAIVLKSTTCSSDTSKLKTIYFKQKTYGNSITMAAAGASGVVDTICSGSNINVYISGSVDRWIYKNGTGAWTAIASSNSSSYTHTNQNIASTTWRYYRALLNIGSCNADTSVMDSVLLRVYGNGNNNAVVPTITSTPVCAGKGASLSVVVPSGSTIQKWIYRDNISGNWLDLYYGTSNTYTDYNTNVSVSTNRSYRIIFLKNCSYDTSGVLSVTILPRVYSNNSSITPTSQLPMICAGMPISNISIPGGNTIVKWIYRDNNSGAWLDFMYGNNNNLTDNNTYYPITIIRSYRAIIDNGVTCTFDTTATLSVTINQLTMGNSSSTTPTASPSNSICTGTAATITVAPGSGNSVVRWTYNVNGGSWIDWGYNTNNSITDYSTFYSTTTTKSYRSLIFQPFSCRVDSSLAVTVTINPRTFGNDNTITPATGTSTVCYGSSNTISVTPGVNNSVSKWIYRDNSTGAWIDIAGSSSSFSDYNYLSASTSRSYRALILKGATCTIDTSASVSVTMSPLNYGNDNTITPTSTVSVCTGSSVSITIAPGSSNTVNNWIYRDNFTGNWNVMSYSTATSVTDYSTYTSSTINRVYRATIRKGTTCTIDTSNVDTTIISPRINGNDNTIVPTTSTGTTVCSNATVALNVNPGSGNSLQKWIYKDNAGSYTDLYAGNNLSANDYYTNVSVSTTRVYRAIITKGTSCTNDSSASVTVTINPRVNGNDNTITPTSTSANYCSGAYIPVSVVPGSGNSVSGWIYRTNGTGAWQVWNVGSSTSATDYNTTTSTSMTRNYRAIITKGSGCTLDTTATLTVTINPVGSGNQNAIVPTSSSSFVCSGNPATVNISGYTGTGIIKWLYRDNGTGAWSVINYNSSYMSDYNTVVSVSTTRSYRAVINNSANCSIDTSGIFNLTLSPITNGNNATAAQTSTASFCSGSAINVFINTPANYSIVGWLYLNVTTWTNFTASTSASVYDYNTTVSSSTPRQYCALLKNNLGCNIDTSGKVSISISPITAGNNNALIPTTGTPAICSGNTAVLNLTGFSGTVIKWLYRDSVIYSWSSINNPSTNLYDNNTNVSYNRTRSYRAIVYNAAYCENDTTAEVLVFIKQQLAGNAQSVTPTSTKTIICSGTSASVNVTGLINGGIVNNWIYSDNNGGWILISGSSGFSYTHTATTVSAPTTRVYRALVLTGCNTDTTAGITFTIDIPLATPVISNITSSDTLVSSITATSYVWKLNGTAISGATTKKIVAPSSGSYTVEVTNAAGCTTASAAFNYIKLGITELQLEKGTNIFPNPSVDGIFNIAFNNINTGETRVLVHDMLGKEILTFDINLRNGNENIQLNMSEYHSGIYFVTISCGEENITRKIMYSK